jgi:hypothetical protein
MRSKAKRRPQVFSDCLRRSEQSLHPVFYGSNVGIEWDRQKPKTLILTPVNAPWRHLRTGHSYFSHAGNTAARLPPGHSEGYIEAFATLYESLFDDIDRVSRDERAVED